MTCITCITYNTYFQKAHMYTHITYIQRTTSAHTQHTCVFNITDISYIHTYTTCILRIRVGSIHFCRGGCAFQLRRWRWPQVRGLWQRCSIPFGNPMSRSGQGDVVLQGVGCGAPLAASTAVLARWIRAGVAHSGPGQWPSGQGSFAQGTGLAQGNGGNQPRGQLVQVLQESEPRGAPRRGHHRCPRIACGGVECHGDRHWAGQCCDRQRRQWGRPTFGGARGSKLPTRGHRSFERQQFAALPLGPWECKITGYLSRSRWCTAPQAGTTRSWKRSASTTQASKGRIEGRAAMRPTELAQAGQRVQREPPPWGLPQVPTMTRRVRRSGPRTTSVWRSRGGRSRRTVAAVPIIAGDVHILWTQQFSLPRTHYINSYHTIPYHTYIHTFIRVIHTYQTYIPYKHKSRHTQQHISCHTYAHNAHACMHNINSYRSIQAYSTWLQTTTTHTWHNYHTCITCVRTYIHSYNTYTHTYINTLHTLHIRNIHYIHGLHA